MDVICPPRLAGGDTIGVISPSSGLAACVPHRLDRGLRFLQERGYRIREFPTTRSQYRWESAPADRRSQDVMDAFTAPEVNAVICTIGGETAVKILEHLDYEKIRRNPKIFCGYSDASVIHYAIYARAGVTTYYGPAILPQFGEYPEPLEYTVDHFFKAVCTESVGKVVPSTEWTEETLNWFCRQDLTRPRVMKRNQGPTWLRGGRSSGPVLGGCLNSIVHLLGTYFWPDHRGHILFLEIAEGSGYDAPTPLSEVDALFGHLRLAGVLAQAKGLIVGRAFKYSDDDIALLKELVVEHAGEYGYPVLYGADIGHTDPMITIPLGSRCRLDSEANWLSFE